MYDKLQNHYLITLLKKVENVFFFCIEKPKQKQLMGSLLFVFLYLTDKIKKIWNSLCYNYIMKKNANKKSKHW